MCIRDSLQKAGLPALTSPFPLMQHTDQIQALSEFLLEYATTLMAAGVHTNRAVRNISRIAAAYGFSADMTIFQRNITMSLICKDDETLRRTSVRKLKPDVYKRQVSLSGNIQNACQ